MPMTSISDIRDAAMALPGAFEKPSYGGQPSWRTKSRMFTWVRDDPEALVVWVESEEEKLALIDSRPDTFFTIDHYDGHPIVLVRIDAVTTEEARELVAESWRLRAPRRAVAEWDSGGRTPDT